MKYFLLMAIRLYWLIPPGKRKKCLFRVSCSKYVFENTKQHGLLHGLTALQYRYKNCRAGSKLFINPLTGKPQMILPDNSVVDQNHIAEHIIRAYI